ncbi:MAG: 16S rRNA (adenine(1518)-N(6)/adenine(1519)-N(6))-dimethyltransferase RsmA [Planctomycetota bacterium]|jgi:16S rRNA (adenine1518-N6/adenine1519-N6)-dimethyltransferase
MTKANRQTISYLRRRFGQVGLEPNARHGQNFLIDLNLIEILAEAADIGPQDVVLEIGTGMGSLTALLAEKAGKVVTVEIDQHLHQLAREELEQYDNVVMIKQDALKNKNHFAQPVLDTVRAALESVPSAQFKLAANLPYNIATPIISNLLICELPPPISMTVTIQKELADRIMAAPNSKDYGALSVWIQSMCRVELVRILPPTVFWPRPKVHSAIIKIILEPERRAAIPDLEFFHQFARSIFFHRRKFLRSVAISAFKERLSKPEVDAVLQAQGLGPEARSEQLSVDQFLELSERFRAVAGSMPEP